MRKTAVLHKQSRIMALITVALLLGTWLPGAALAGETPELTFSGDPKAPAILNNINYTDIRNAGNGLKEAIYQTGALDIFKGFDRRFNRTGVLTKEEAIALAYRAAGREADAQLAAENLNRNKAVEDKKKDAVSYWMDGYLQLAANEGLITQQELNEAMNPDPSAPAGTTFKRDAAAQKQDFAVWLAKTLGLQPIRGQQSLFNNYLDWKSADPEKVPYIESVMQAGIMSGDGNGRFRPTGPVTRESAALMLQNAENVILPLLKYEKYTGTIETVTDGKDYSGKSAITKREITVRNSNGKLHSITAEIPAASAVQKKELVVYKNGSLGDSRLLKNGDRVEYIAGTDPKTIKFVNVISNVNEVRYVAAEVLKVDQGNQLLEVVKFFDLDYPDLDQVRQNISFSSGNDAELRSYRYSSRAQITVDGRNGTIADVRPDASVILTLDKNQVITAIQSADFDIAGEDRQIVRGIVEENNPQLGYITLFNADGSGTRSTSGGKPVVLRNYTYFNPNRVEVLRNHKPARFDDIEAGDTVYLKLDEDGSIVSASAVDNYTVKYGRIISKLPAEILVEYENGTQQILKMGKDVLIIEDKRLADYNALKDGDRVRLLLNITNKATTLKEMTIEGDEHFIANIYKGAVAGIDDMSGKMTVQNLRALEKDSWKPSARKGFTAIPLADECIVYFGDRQVDVDRVNQLLSGNEAYIAVEADYGGQEKVVLVSFRNEKDTEAIYDDSLTGIVPGSGMISLNREYKNVRFGPGSIVVKYGRLVTGSSLQNDDPAYIVANREYGSGEFRAGVVRIDERGPAGFGQLFRGRIKFIHENLDFTVESFSQWREPRWEFQNAPKTFRLTPDTRILSEDGLVNVRDFIGYGEDSFINTTVYILADDTDAKLISTAPFGTVQFRGTVYEIEGGTVGEEGTQLEEPDKFKLRDVKTYDPVDFLWKTAPDMEISLLVNSIVIKDGKACAPSEIRKDDVIRVIRKDSGVTGDGYIIFVEN